MTLQSSLESASQVSEVQVLAKSFFVIDKSRRFTLFERNPELWNYQQNYYQQQQIRELQRQQQRMQQEMNKPKWKYNIDTGKSYYEYPNGMIIPVD